MRTPVQHTKSDIAFAATEDDLSYMHNIFKKQNCIRLHNFLEPELLQFLQKKIKQSAFYEDKYKMDSATAVDYRLKDKTIDSLLRFLMNDERLFDFIEKLTGCNKIGLFQGAVFSLVPGYGHYDSWHQDNFDNRMVSMSINLSTDVFSGGTLRIRDYKSKEILYEITNTGFGDCVIFPVSPDMEHMVTGVTGTVARTAFPGWFCSRPSYKTILNRFSKVKKRTSQNKINVSKDSNFVVKEEIFLRKYNGQNLIFNLENRICYELDQVGVRVLKLLVKPIMLDEILDVISREYDVRKEQCEPDIMNLLNELIANRLINVSENNPASYKLLQTTGAKRK